MAQYGICFLQVIRSLQAMPAISQLQELELSAGTLSDFPATLTSRLTQLTHLGLRENEIKMFPRALAQLTSLVVLDLSYNKTLQLEDETAAVVAAMPNLKCLDLSKGNKQDSAKLTHLSVHVLFTIRARFPSLRLEGFE